MNKRRQSLALWLLNGVLQPHNAARIHPMGGQLQLALQRRRCQERATSTQQNRNDRRLYGIHTAYGEQTSYKVAAAKQPDILSRLRSQRVQPGFDIAGDNGNGRMLFLPKGPGKDEDALAPKTLGVLLYALVGSAAHQQRIELVEEFSKVNAWLVDNPAGLASTISNITI